MDTKQYILSAWDWNPVIIGVCLAALGLYAFTMRLHFSARAWWFLGGVALFFVALASPLSALAAGYLFSAHMLQHMLLLLIVPLLILLGLRPLDGIVPRKDRRFGLPPLMAWVGGVAAMWIWHERTLCDLATRTGTFRVLQIISLLALGAMFWWPLFGPRLSRRLPPLSGVIYLFSACAACSVLGILITFAPGGTVCPVYLNPPDQPAILHLIRQNWGLNPANDQQIGGLLMWVPGCGIYLAGIMALLARWYGSTGSHEQSPSLHAKFSSAQLDLANPKLKEP